MWIRRRDVVKGTLTTHTEQWESGYERKCFNNFIREMEDEGDVKGYSERKTEEKTSE